MRGRMKGAIAMLGLGMVLGAAALPAGAAAAGAPAREELLLYLSGATGHGHENTLGLTVLPQDGVAVVTTVESDVEIENDRGVAYAVRIPEHPLGGRVDVRFPGLGRFVGEFVLDKGESRAGCGAGGAKASGHFIGDIEFRGSGGYHRWTATRAGAWVHCPPETEGPYKTLFGYVAEEGPWFSGGSDGPLSFLAAESAGPRRVVEFYAETRGFGPEETVGFTVDDLERLHGGVAANRWLTSRGALRESQFEIAPGGKSPVSATLSPGAPFSGEASYSRKDRSLTGDLAVHLLGRTVRIAGKDTKAFLSNRL